MDMYYGFIAIWPINWAPEYTAYCQGQQQQVSQNAALFSLIGNLYGGDGRTTFNLPDLRARVVIGTGQAQYSNPPPAVLLAQTGGSSIMTASVTSIGSVTLSSNNLPSHSHTATFAPVMGPVQVPISQAGNLGVNVQVQASAPTSPPAVTLSGPQYLTNLGAPPAARGPYSTTTLSGTPASLAGVQVTGSSGVTANPTINVVTGGQVAVGNTGAGLPAPVQVTGQVNGPNFQPSLALNFIICTQGLYPPRP